MDLIITYPLYILFIYFSFTSSPTYIRELCTNVFNTFVSCVNGRLIVRCNDAICGIVRM